jgi:hypothetical protein
MWKSVTKSMQIGDWVWLLTSFRMVGLSRAPDVSY